MTVLAELFGEFFLLAFVAFGGATALLPEMQRVVVEKHQWMDAATFAHLYAIAQAAPGPNVLVVTLIGWELAGVAGAFAATLAICLPMSVLVFLLFRHWDSFRDKPWQQAIQLGVAPLAVGLIGAGASLIGVSANLGWPGWALVGLAFGLHLGMRHLHPLWLIGAGALLGVLVGL